MHCSVMGQEALEKAIAHYRGVRALVEEEEERGRIVCKCFGVTEEKIERVVRENHLTTIEEVTNYVKAGGGCKKCHEEIQEIIDRVTGVSAPREAPARAARRMTNLQKIKLIEETMEREVRPMLQADGGDVELIDVDGDRVYVALRGMCAGCPSAKVTLRTAVQGKLREFVSEGLIVEEVTP